MAWTANRQALDGGDLDAWAAFEQAQNHLAIGVNTTNLYLDGADLKITAGMIGLYNGSNYYNLINSAAAIISVAGLTASCWAKIENSVVAGNVVVEITSIAGATSRIILPSSFTGSYNGAKGGYYETATKRIIGLVWIDAGGLPAYIINTYGGMPAYTGLLSSDNPSDTVSWKTADYTILDQLTTPATVIIYMTGGRTLTLPSAVLNPNVRCKIIKSNDNAWWVKIISAAGTMSSKSGAAATVSYIRRYMDSVTWVSDGTNWYAIDDTRLLFIDSGAIRCSEYRTKERGTVNLVHTGAAMTEATIKGMKLVGNTSASYGWITAYDSGTKMIYLRDVTCTDTAKIFSNGETLNIVDVDAAAVTSTTLSAADWKNTESKAYHGLDCTLEKLDVQFYYSTDGTTWSKTYAVDNGRSNAGQGVLYNSVNQLENQTFSDGILIAQSAGSCTLVTTTDSYYKIVMRKI